MAESAYTSAGDDNSFSIKTDYKKPDGSSFQNGWHIKGIYEAGTYSNGQPAATSGTLIPAIASSGWLQVNQVTGNTRMIPESENASGFTNLDGFLTTYNLYLMTTANTTGAERAADIIIAAGPLEYAIRVRQGLAKLHALTVTYLSNEVTELVWAAGTNDARTINVKWDPSTVQMQGTLVVGSSPFSFLSSITPFGGTAISNSYTHSAGGQNFIITPSTADPLAATIANPFPELRSTLNFNVTYEGNPLSKSVILRKSNYHAYIGSSSTEHTAIGTTYSSVAILSGSPTHIPIRTNAAKWSATIIPTTGSITVWNGTGNTSYAGTAPVIDRGGETLSNLIPGGKLLTAAGLYNTDQGDPITVATNNRLTPADLALNPLPGGSMKVLIHFMDADGGNTTIPDAVVEVKLLTGVIQREANSYIIPKGCIVPIDRKSVV